jgi:exodeoxyribonuclease VII large subunit
MQQPKAYTVSAITRMIKSSLEESFYDIWIEGEITDYHNHTSSGHRYLNLKDENSVLRTTIWRSVGSKLKFEPENGQNVLVYGNITVFEKAGQYQLNCRKIVPVGIGELELAFRQLYEKLSNEGLFDDDIKKPIPQYAQKIGIVTSPTGAAIRDIIQISKRRNKSVELIIYPSAVQGIGAENSIADGISYFNNRDNIDIIITGRGGGSLEDLWCFNTEKVVRAIYSSKIPVISAVGHEIDTTLADFASDLRAPTPSAAAELAVWSKKEFLDNISSHIYTQTTNLRTLVESYREFLTSIINRPVFTRPKDIVLQRQQYIDNLCRIFLSAGKNRFEMAKNRLSLLASRLETLSPLGILARGYSVSQNLTGKKLIRSVDDISVDNRMKTTLTDGTIISKISKIIKRKADESKKEI